MDRSSLPLLNPPMVRSIGWVSGATHKLPVNSLRFLKLLLCREVSETRLGRDPWVTTLLARGREDRERDLRRAGSGELSVLETAHRHSPG